MSFKKEKEDKKSKSSKEVKEVKEVDLSKENEDIRESFGLL
jgi:hypothetical protein